jgi:hypothetical protein
MDDTRAVRCPGVVIGDLIRRWSDQSPSNQHCHPERGFCSGSAGAKPQSKDPVFVCSEMNVERNSLDAGE